MPMFGFDKKTRGIWKMEIERLPSSCFLFFFRVLTIGMVDYSPFSLVVEISHENKRKSKSFVGFFLLGFSLEVIS